MSRIEEERIAKQAFLKEAIIDKGVTPQRFSEFVQNMKDEPLDIDNWTLEELKKIVELFEQSEIEAKNNVILSNTNSHAPYTKLKCDPIEFIAVVG